MNASYLHLFLLTVCFTLIGCGYDETTQHKPVTISPFTSEKNDAASLSGLDKSPMDMSYYPTEYPKLKMANTLNEPLVARVIYSRPKKDGRIIFGDVVKYGSSWRLGANEATEIEFFKDVKIKNKTVNKGRYVMYCIPQANQWTLVLNNDLYTWGLKIDSTKDAYKFTIPIEKTNYPFEHFTMEFQKTEPQMQLVMAWDSVKAILPINY